jgi:hypothetical protein
VIQIFQVHAVSIIPTGRRGNASAEQRTLTSDETRIFPHS